MRVLGSRFRAQGFMVQDFRGRAASASGFRK